jgi:ligand-binding sensor protein
MGTESDKQAVKPGRRQLQRTAAAPAQSAAGRLHGRLSGTLSIPDFCDMELFEQVLRDWAQSTGLATVAIGSDGRYLSGYYNFTDFCEKLTRLSPEGLRRCTECDKNGAGVYQCHAGLVDFASPITSGGRHGAG